jgi:uncharacterized protein (UPF0276 family)
MRIGLGVGLDLPWRGPYGIVDGRVSARTQRFLQRYADRFDYLFVSWQPPNRGTPKLADCTAPFDDLFANVSFANKALHQSALNLAGADYDRRAIIALTNELAARYGFAWVNEDLGHWSVRGRPLPYPQPPRLSDDGIAWCTRVCREVAGELAIPLVVEFPGFEARGAGGVDAYDAFRRIVEGAGVSCTLDTGHLLTWRHLAGHRGDALLEDLERLPLDHCVEIHCAGTIVSDGRIVDAHHGVLAEAQLELVARLVVRCPALRVVTWEDPRFDADGVLPPALLASLDALEARTRTWLASPPLPPPRPRVELVSGPDVAATPWEDELAAEFESPSELGRRCRAQVLSRGGRGVGRIRDVYADAIASWCALHTQCDDPLDAIVLAFLASPPGRAWSEFAWAVPGSCIEDAFGRFLAPGTHAHLDACARALAMHPDPPFAIPPEFSRAPQGWYAIREDAHDGPVLYAAVAGKLITGPITASIRALLGGEHPAGCEPVRERLVTMGLLAAQVPGHVSLGSAQPNAM